MLWRSGAVILHVIINTTNLMILLTVYKEPAGKTEKIEFIRMQEAIEFGQKSGSDYDIYDPVAGKVIDWNEVNVQEDDGWYYDEQEYLWKRFTSDDDPENSFVSVDFRHELISQFSNLRCA